MARFEGIIPALTTPFTAADDAEAAAFYSVQHINRVRAYMELS